MIYDNTRLRTEFKNFLSQQISRLETSLVLDIFLVGSNLASLKYVSNKQKIGQDLGVRVELHHFAESQLMQLKTEFRQVPQTSGLILQLPAPAESLELLDTIGLEQDVDFLNPANYPLWDLGFLPPTIRAIDLVLKDLFNPNQTIGQLLQTKLNLAGQTIAVIGQGKLVGKPLLEYLVRTRATIISVNIDTVQPHQLTRQADIVISAAGSPHLLDRTWFNSKAILIDAATSEDQGQLKGDIHPDQVWPTNTLVKSPGGIGPITVLSIFYNLFQLRLAKIQSCVNN
jgi:methylenetetrahydrofolate dehydrogenase (NADP+)/methenyltetrahydrofolate cyclohydrolase